jgi:acetylornithine deacetylase/succinyl-diaminopimelate desuccinylase-like protein
LNLVELCQKAISIDSSESHGTLDAADYFAEIGWKLGLMVEVIEDVDHGRQQKIILLRPNGHRPVKDLLLSAQIGTRDPNAYSAWTKTGANPFNASIEGDSLYGLGATESKLDFVAKMMSLVEFSNTRFNRLGPVVVSGFGGPSGASTLKVLRRRLIDAQYALVGDATQLHIADRGPGYAHIEVFVPYSAEERAHLAKMQYQENVMTQSKCFTADKSLTEDRDFTENPISELLAYLKNLPEGLVLVSADGGQSATAHPDAAWLEIELFDGLRETVIPKLANLFEVLQRFALEFRTVRDPDFNPTYSRMNLGRIETRPDGISISGSCHFVPKVTRELYDKWLADLRAACEKIGGEFQLLDFREPFHGKLDGTLGAQLRNILQESNRPQDPVVAKRCSEANLLARFRVETLVFGPGRVVDSQLANEHISIAELETATSVYRKLIQRICE